MGGERRKRKKEDKGEGRGLPYQGLKIDKQSINTLAMSDNIEYSTLYEVCDNTCAS